MLQGISTREHLVRDPLLEGRVREYLDMAARSGSDRCARSRNDEESTYFPEADERKNLREAEKMLKESVIDLEEHASRMPIVEPTSGPMQTKAIKLVSRGTFPEDNSDEIKHSSFKANYAVYPVFLVFSRLPNVFETS